MFEVILLWQKTAKEHWAAFYQVYTVVNQYGNELKLQYIPLNYILLGRHHFVLTITGKL